MKKKALFIAPCLPYPPNSGGDIRLFNLIKHSSDEFEISLLTYGDSHSLGDRVADLKKQAGIKNVFLVPAPYFSNGIISRFWSKNPFGANYSVNTFFRKTVIDTMRKYEFDLVCMETLYMSQYARFVRNSKIVVSLYNIESENLKGYLAQRQLNFIQSFLLLFQLALIRRMEASLSRIADAIIVVSEHDKKLIQSRDRQCNAHVIQNGVSLEYFTPLPRKSRRIKRILFMGTMFYLPNIQAAVYYATKVHPLISQKYPDAEFIVAGKEPTPEVMALSHISGVKITGTVPDMRKQLEECDVVVVPLLSGSGTRIKVLEAMASARPVVSTEKGCEGLDARHRENILISDGTPEDFANQVLSLFSSDELVRKLVEGGLAMAKANAWRHHAKRQLLVFEEIT